MRRIGEAGRRRTDGPLTSWLLLLWAAVPVRCDIAQQYITTSSVQKDAVADPNWLDPTNDKPVRSSWTSVNQNVRWDTAVVIEFAENIQVGSGYITIQPPVLSVSPAFGVSSASATTLTVPGSGVTVATTMLTINGASRRLIWSETTTYTISFDAGVVINSLVPPDTNAAFSVQFTIGDFTSPMRLYTFPAQNANAADPTAAQSVTITFNEAIQLLPISAVSPGSVGLQDRYNRQSPQQQFYYCNDPAHVSVSGATATIWFDPAQFQILPCQNYVLTYPYQCFLDVSPNRNGAAALPNPPSYSWWSSCITNYNPAPSATQISIATNIVLTFGENIVAPQPSVGGTIVLTPLGETPISFSVNDATRVLFNVPTGKQITILGNVPPAYLCVGKTMQQCKGKPIDVTIPAGAIERYSTASNSPPLVLAAGLPAQLSGVPSQYRFTFKAADLTPPVMTIVSMYGISENVIRVTVRLDESGTTYCRAYPSSTFNPVSQGGTSLPTLFDCAVCTNRIFASSTGVIVNYFASAVYDPVKKYAEMAVDVANLNAKTFYWVYCFAMDVEIPTANVDTSSQMLATERYVRTLDTTPPSFGTFTCAPTALNENSITVTLSLNEAGRAYCKVVNGGFAMPSPNAVIAEGFYADVAGTATFTIAVNQITTGLGATGMEALLRKTRYDMYCWAQDAEGYPYSGPNGMASAVACPQNTVVTLDITRPNMRFIMAESISKSQIFITLQVDEGSKVWCAAWATDPLLTATNYETSIKSQAASCTDNKGRTCGTWWIYDLVDIWDTAADGVATQSDYDATNIWHYNQDVNIILNGLVEATAYPFIYCYAEDDETDGLGSAPNKMLFDNVGNVGPNNVYTIKTGIGTVTTLDESPPSFTQLAIRDPTLYNDRIVVTFKLNEAGTAYCRVTRSDSGETTLRINRILTANYPGVVGAAGIVQYITVDKLQSTDTVGLYEAAQYDVYCWAKDSAVDTQGQPRPNYQTQTYVDTAVGLTMAAANTNPQGGKTMRVWVQDLTPPVMIYVASEALTDTILQVTLQLNEPGTVWCQAALPSTATTAASWLDASDITAVSNFKQLIQGRSGLATYMQFVPQEFINVDVAMSMLETQLGNTAVALTSKTAYNIFCFAMDDWRLQAENAAVKSVNFDPLNEASTTPNEVSYLAVSSFSTRVGIITTLDLTPPSITITGASSLETSITVTLRMDESGTAWCQAVRKGFNPPTILEILDTNFYNTFTYNAATPTAVTTVVLTGYDRPKNAYPNYVTPLVLATRYEVYCYGEDVLCQGCKVTNGMSQSNVQLTMIAIRTKDLTPPNMRFVAAESIAKDKLSITVQVDEGAKVWCAAWTTDPLLTALTYQGAIKAWGSPPNTFTCKDNQGRTCGSFWIYDLNDVQDVSIVSKGITGLSDYQLASTWRYNEDVNIILSGLTEQTSYPFIYCYAEDDENDGLGASPNPMLWSTALANSGPNNVYTIQQAIGTVYTLDESPPTFKVLAMMDPTLANNQIVVTFQLNEAGTAYCRVTRTDSGETTLKINQVLSAAYSTTVAAGNTVGYITVDKLESRDPATATLFEASQYDVYCWAKDSAVDTQGLPRPNYQLQSYLDTPVGNVNSPAGGKTQFVWVKDTTPPTVIFVAREALSETTIQITLQLNEPGTVWCHPVMPLPSATLVDVTDITPATYISYIKGRVAKFSQVVPTAYTNVYVAVNQIDRDTGTTAAALTRATQYNIFCHAEDDWNAQAANAASLSINYNIANVPTSPPPSGNGNEISYTAAQAVQTAIGIITTLNLTPPQITVTGSSTAETSITVTVQLDTSGTVWCQAVRQNFNVPTILEILDTSFSSPYTYSTSLPTPTTTVVISGYDRPFNYNNAYVTPLVLGTRYDVYCYAEDVLCPGCKVTNGVTSATVAGTKTSVRTKDLTPPNMRFVNAESIAKDQIIVTIQVDEGALVWCAAWQTSPGFTTSASAVTGIKTQAATGTCKDGYGVSCGVFWVYDLDMLIAPQAAYSNWNTWKINQDVDIIISGLTEKTPYPFIYCYAEDDETPANGMIFNSAAQAGPSNMYTIQQAIGSVQTLDESPPSFTRLALQDPSLSNQQLVVTLTLNEAGTAYCRVTRSDSGETTLRINQILTAGFSTYVASPAVTGYITINKLESRDTALLFEASQYDVYCWAMDSAVDTQGLPRPNYMLQSYVDTLVGANVASPLGGKTRNVWVTDTTPPQIIVVAREAIAEDTIQVTLQLNEPGTIWCQVAQDVGATAGTFCRDQDVVSSVAGCVFDTWTKGTVRAAGSTVFQAFVPIPYQDYDINMNFMEKITPPTAGVSLVGVTNYWVWCFAEDDWVLQASYTTTYGALSASFVAPTGPNKITLASATAVRASIGRVMTLDQTAPVFTAIAGTQQSETVLTMTVTLDTPATVWCMPVRQNFAQPSINEILQNNEYNSACGTTACTVTNQGLQPKTMYDIWCYCEDTNVYPQRPNGRMFTAAQKVTLSTLDTTPPVLTIVSAESPIKTDIRVKVKMDEPGTVYCNSWVRGTAYGTPDFSSISNGGYMSYVGLPSQTPGGPINTNVEVVVTGRAEQTAYDTYCTAVDISTLPTVNRVLDTVALTTAPAIGVITTLDQSPPTFTVLGASGTNENTIQVTFRCNEACSAYCRVTRSDSGETSLSINRILKANFQASWASGGDQTININRLENDPTQNLLERSTLYDTYCWIQDTAVQWSCYAQGAGASCSTYPKPNYQSQTYVGTAFGGTPPATQRTPTLPLGGLMLRVRTPDLTPPTVIFVQAESTEETSITVTLQMDEPGTAFCKAFTSTQTVNAALYTALSTGTVYQNTVTNWNNVYRNFQIKVANLVMETKYYVYCSGEDDEYVEGMYTIVPAPLADNKATPFLTESTGRWTLDLTPPVITVMAIYSTSETSATVDVKLDEPGTVWCQAVRTMFTPPTINQIIAASFSTFQGTGNVQFSVTVQNLVRDTEYDVYCHARDTGTTVGAGDPPAGNPGNDITYATVLTTKRDIHTMGDSTPPIVVTRSPVQAATNVPVSPVVTITFNEDIQAGTGLIIFTPQGAGSAISLDVVNMNTGTCTNGAQLSITLTTLKVDFSQCTTTLTSGVRWYISFAAGVIKDTSYAANPVPAFGTGQTAFFTTGTTR